jgi:hypothetical protein
MDFRFSIRKFRYAVLLDPDCDRILLLRSTEWANWPLFILQPIVPILLLFVPWWEIIIGILILSYAWTLIRNKYQSINLTLLGAFSGRLKWPVSIVMGIVFLISAQYIQSALSFIWPAVTIFLMLFIPVTDLGPIQERFRIQLLAEFQDEQV